MIFLKYSFTKLIRRLGLGSLSMRDFSLLGSSDFIQRARPVSTMISTYSYPIIQCLFTLPN